MSIRIMLVIEDKIMLDGFIIKYNDDDDGGGSMHLLFTSIGYKRRMRL